MPDDRALPELVRSLRSLGAVRSDAEVIAHDAIFPPLLHARARAANAPRANVLAALRGDALAARIEACVVDAAVGNIVNAAHARARTAEATDLIQPLRTALIALDAIAVSVSDGGEEWDAWVGQLRRVFVAADTVAQNLAVMLARTDAPPAGSRWFGGQAR